MLYWKALKMFIQWVWSVSDFFYIFASCIYLQLYFRILVDKYYTIYGVFFSGLNNKYNRKKIVQEIHYCNIFNI